MRRRNMQNKHEGNLQPEAEPSQATSRPVSKKQTLIFICYSYWVIGCYAALLYQWLTNIPWNRRSTEVVCIIFFLLASQKFGQFSKLRNFIFYSHSNFSWQPSQLALLKSASYRVWHSCPSIIHTC